MANYNIQNADIIGLENEGKQPIDINTNDHHLLTFDENAVYKLTLNAETQKYLANIGFLVGKKENNNSEIFNDYENNIAQEEYVHVEGCGNVGRNKYQHVQGCYNAYEGLSTDIIHVVGNGKSNSERSNAHTLNKNGNAWFAGTLTTEGKLTTKDISANSVTSSGDVVANGISLKNINQLLNATGSGSRRPIVRYGNQNQFPSINDGVLGDIFCLLI